MCYLGNAAHTLIYIFTCWTRTGRWEFDRSHDAGTSSPSHWQQVAEQAPKPMSWMMFFPLMSFVPAQKLYVNIHVYIYIYILYMNYTIGRIYIYIYIYIYIQQECRSVLVKLHHITFYRTVFLGSARFPGWMPLFFPLVYQLCLVRW